MCNVGKHARGVTRIVVTGEEREGNYLLKVQDNGCGLKPGKEQQKIVIDPFVVIYVYPFQYGLPKIICKVYCIA